MAHPRVMVSSVVRGFEEMRSVAREAILSVGGIPVLVNEDQSATTCSSRNTCLDQVASSDILVSIVGERGGYVAPSGKLVIEEEFDEARRLGLEVLLIVQRGGHDLSCQAFLARAEDYVKGLFRAEFSTSDELRSALIGALKPVLKSMKLPESCPEEVTSLAKREVQGSREPHLRVVCTPVRATSVLKPQELTSSEFQFNLVSLGHQPAVKLLNYCDSTSAQGTLNSIVIKSLATPTPGGLVVEIILTESLSISVLTKLEPANSVGSDFSSFFVLDENIVRRRLEASLRFMSQVYSLLDPHIRFHQLYMNSCLHGVEGRRIEPDPQPRHSWSGSVIGTSSLSVLAFDETRRLTREELHHERDLCQDILFRLRFRVNGEP